jgi:predicted NAD/FAD-dependent oxidoreductase
MQNKEDRGTQSVNTPRVAVIGGGISGLVCANHLKALGLQPTVYDTGKRGVGGRMSSRTVQVEDCTYVLDHSTQFFTATDAVFAEMVAEWKAGGCA